MDRSIATVPGSSPGILAPIGNAVAAAELAVRQVFVAVKHRLELSGLLDCEDERLADIGITRDDLRSALSCPFWRDPTTVLARRIGEPERRLPAGDRPHALRPATDGVHVSRSAIRRPTTAHPR